MNLSQQEGMFMEQIHNKLEDVFALAREMTNWNWELGSASEWLWKDCSDNFIEECMKLLKLKKTTTKVDS